MHQALPRQRIGVPWPVNICRAGLGTGPCTILLYKDPLDPAAADVPTPFSPAVAGDLDEGDGRPFRGRRHRG